MIRLATVSPCYNEEEVLRHSIERLTALFERMIAEELISKDSMMVFVNDGSRDRTWDIIREMHAENKLVRGINMSRNVGHQNAIMAGMMTAREWADAVVTLDADLQDDIECIPQMVKDFEAGNDIVYGVKVSREADSFMKRFSAQTFYKVQSSMGVESVYNHADFRLMSRRALAGVGTQWHHCILGAPPIPHLSCGTSLPGHRFHHGNLCGILALLWSCGAGMGVAHALCVDCRRLRPDFNGHHRNLYRTDIY